TADRLALAHNLAEGGLGNSRRLLVGIAPGARLRGFPPDHRKRSVTARSITRGPSTARQSPAGTMPTGGAAPSATAVVELTPSPSDGAKWSVVAVGARVPLTPYRGDVGVTLERRYLFPPDYCSRSRFLLSSRSKLLAFKDLGGRLNHRRSRPAD